MDPKLKLEIDLGRNKLKTHLKDAREDVRQETDRMQDELNDLKVPAIDTKEAKSSLKDLQEDVKGMFSSLRGGDFMGAGSGAFSMFKNNGATLAALGVTAAAIAAVGIAGVKTYNHLSEVSREVGEWQRTTTAVFQKTGNEADRLTAKIAALSKGSGKDFNELALASNNFYREFQDQGLKAEQSLTLLQKGLIATNNLMDVDNVREYSAQLKQAGYNAEEAMSFIAQQVSSGTFSDKLVDTIKEGGLRIREMTQATSDAITALGLKPKELLKDLNSGAKSMKQTIEEITNAMASANIRVRQTATANIFGGPGEDLGERALLNIGKYNKSLDEMVDLQGEAGQRIRQRLELEESIIQKQERFAPLINRVSDKMELMKLQAKEVFYSWINKGFEALGLYGDKLKITSKDFADLGIKVKEFDYYTRDIETVLTNINKLRPNEAVFDMEKGFMEKKKPPEESRYSVADNIKIFNTQFELSKGKGRNYNSSEWRISGKLFGEEASKALTKETKPFAIKLADDFFGVKKSDNKEQPKGARDPQTVIDPKSPTATSDINKIAGQAQQVKNVTINFDSYIKGDVITQNQQIKNMNQDELMRWLNDNFKRLLQSVELSY